MYFACGAYSEPSRKQSHSIGAQSFWLDIDCGPGKPYPDAGAGEAALSLFLAKTGLQEPTVVYSGSGLHVYFTTDRLIEPVEWRRAALGLKALTKKHGLHADDSRTTDIASILRPVSTRNRKVPNDPKPVFCRALAPVISAGSLLPLLLDGSAGANILGGMGAEGNARFTNISGPPTASAERAAGRCVQLNRVRETKGNVGEPLWYAALCLLAKCADGDELAHFWSSGHPEYSEQDTAVKYAHAKASPGPSTCERFESANPGGCAGCPFAGKITSPIQLGEPEFVEKKPVEVPKQERPWLPKGWKWGGSMELIGSKPDEDNPGSFVDFIISPFPIHLMAVRRAEKSGLITFEFRKKEPHRDWHSFEIPAEEMFKSTWPSIMARYGASIRSEGRKSFINYLEAAVEKLKHDADEGTQYEQFGWKEDWAGFLIGDTFMGSDGSTLHSPGTKEAGNRARSLAISTTADLGAWTAAANKLFAPGFETQGVALLASFAAPLMRFITKGEEGGAVFHIFTPGSGQGKSTALSAAASVWGKRDGLQIKDADTFVGKERSLCVACDLPVFFDELAMDNPKSMEDFVRFFTTGKSKNRGTRSGTVDQAPMGWSTILISAANVSMVEKLMSRGSAVPMSARVLEVPMVYPADAPKDLTRRLEDSFIANRGIAGRQFMSYLVNPQVRQHVQDIQQKMIINYTQALGGNTADRYLIWLMACIGTAGIIVNKLGLVNCDMKHIMAHLLELVKERRRSFTTRTCTDILVGFFSEFADTCVVLSGPASVKRPPAVLKEPRGAIYMRLEQSTGRLFMLPDPFRDYCSKYGYSFLTVARELENKGVVLNRNRMFNLTGSTNLAPVKGTCWEVDAGHPALGVDQPREVISEVEAEAS